MAEPIFDISALEGARNFLTRGMSSAGSSAVALGGELLQGSQKLSDYSNALVDNMKIFEGFGKVIKGLVSFAEQSLEEYQTLSGMGASFGKEMTQIRITAAELGITVEDMIELLQDNSESLRTFGGTTDQAISNFTAFSKGVLDSNVGLELRRLGFTARDINETLIAYNEIAQQDGLNNRRSTQDQIRSAREFAIELDALSKLTGKEREILQDEMRERRRQGDVQAFLMGQSAETQEQFMLATQKISDTMGPQFAKLFEDLMIRGAPITEETRNAFIALGGSADEFEATVASFRQGMSSNDFSGFNRQLTEAQGAFAGYLKTEEARNIAMLGGLSDVSQAMGDAYESSYNFTNSLDAAAEGAEDPTQTLMRIQTDIAEQQQTQLEDQGRLIDTTIELQQSLRDLTIAATSEVLPRMEEMAMTAVNKVMDALPSSQQIASELGKAVGNIFNAADTSIYKTGVFDGLGAFGAATDSAIDESASRITGAIEGQDTGSDAATTEDVDASTETVTGTINDTEASIKEGQEAAAERVEAAEATLTELQGKMQDALARGDFDRAAELAQELATTQQELEAAQAEVAQGTESNIGGKVDETEASLTETSSTLANETMDVLGTSIAETEAKLTTGQENLDQRVVDAETNLSDLQKQVEEALRQGQFDRAAEIQEKIDALENTLSTKMEQNNSEIISAVNKAISAVERKAKQTSTKTTTATPTFKPFANGGDLFGDFFGLVGENGPEIIEGPARITNTQQTMNILSNLLKGINKIESVTQTTPTLSENSISTNNENSAYNIAESITDKKLDQMIHLLGQLVYVENQAAETAVKTLRTTKGLSGNMLKGISG